MRAEIEELRARVHHLKREKDDAILYIEDLQRASQQTPVAARPYYQEDLQYQGQRYHDTQQFHKQPARQSGPALQIPSAGYNHRSSSRLGIDAPLHRVASSRISRPNVRRSPSVAQIHERNPDLAGGYGPGPAQRPAFQNDPQYSEDYGYDDPQYQQ